MLSGKGKGLLGFGADFLFALPVKVGVLCALCGDLRTVEAQQVLRSVFWAEATVVATSSAWPAVASTTIKRIVLDLEHAGVTSLPHHVW